MHPLVKIYLATVGRYALGVALSMVTQSLVEKDIIDKTVVETKYIPTRKSKTPQLDKLESMLNGK